MAEQRNIHTRGIIIKKHPLGENDFSVTLYSPDLGKIQATAKGARKITSSFSGHLESLNICSVQLYKSPARYTIVQCQIIENFKNIRNDFNRMLIAGLIMEIFHKSTHSSEHSPELYDLLEQSLGQLSMNSQHFLTVERFKLNLLLNIGVLPDLENCDACHRRWRSDDTIWLEPEGHLRCRECVSSHAPAKQIQFNIIKLIHHLVQPLAAQVQKISCTPEQKEQLQHITRFFLQHFLDREIISEKILMELI